MSHQCYFCEETKRVGFIVALERGNAFSVCRECGEEIILCLKLREVSETIWAPSDPL